MRVLVIDDEGTVRLSCERILEAEGAETVCVSRGEDGLKLLSVDEFDAVLLDLMMPGISGLETLRRLRESHANLPVVVITGYATPEVEEECRRNGATVWLPKPFGPDEVMRSLRQALVS